MNTGKSRKRGERKKTDAQKASEKAIREAFGRKLKAIREERKIQQNMLAEDLGIHTQTISRYERSLIDPTLTSLIALAKYFNTTMDWLSDYSATPYTDKDCLQIPYAEDESKHWIVNGAFLKTLTDKTNLSVFIAKNNNLYPAIQKGDILLVNMEKTPAVDKYVLLLSGSEYIIKRVMSVSKNDHTVRLYSGADMSLNVSMDEIVGVVEAFCRGHL